jgi:hypothetical protein
MHTLIMRAVHNLFVKPSKEKGNILDYLSFGIIFLVTLLLIINPIGFFQDDWYHMKVSQIILEKGYVPMWNYWEYAPIGRPHVYPPLLSIVIAILSLVTSSVMVSTMLVKIFTYPILLLSFWLVSKKMWGSRTGFFTLLSVLSVAPLLFMSVCVMPATLVLAISPLVIYTFLKKRLLTTSLLLSISLWLHTLLPWLLIGSLFLFSMLNRKTHLSFFIKSSLLAFMTFLPWAIHTALNSTYLNYISTPSNVTLPAVVTLVSIPSIITAIRKRQSSLIFICLLLSLSVLLISYGHRFWPYAVLAISFFSGMTIDGLLKSEVMKRKIGIALAALVIFTCLMVMPGIYQGINGNVSYLSETAFSWLLSNSAQLNVFNPPYYVIDPRLNTNSSNLQAASLWIKSITTPNETVALVGVYGTDASLVSFLSDRNVSSGGWRESMNGEMLSSELSFVSNDAKIFLLYFPSGVPSEGLIDIKFSKASEKITVKVEKVFGNYLVSERSYAVYGNATNIEYVYDLL